MVYKRKPDWPERLHVVVQDAKSKGFVWGDHDCFLFAARCADAMTGSEIFDTWTVTYNTETGAARNMVKHGLKSLEDLAANLCAQHGWQEHVDTRLTRRGDLCIVLQGNETLFGVCIGHQVASTGLEGLVLSDLSTIQRSWRVG